MSPATNRKRIVAETRPTVHVSFTTGIVKQFGYKTRLTVQLGSSTGINADDAAFTWQRLQTSAHRRTALQFYCGICWRPERLQDISAGSVSNTAEARASAARLYIFCFLKLNVQ